MRPASPNRRQTLLVLAGAAFAGPAVAAAPAAPADAPLSAADADLVERGRAYIRSLTSAKGRFAQTDARGQITEGTFYLQRPGRARFEYDPPSGVVLASNGFRVAVVNPRLKTIQAYPLGMTPLGLLLSRDIRIDKGVVVGKVIRTAGGFSIVAHDSKGRAEGQITLDFTLPMVSLAGWTIIDAQGGMTKVRLLDFATAGKFPTSLFELQPPT